jgi:hypothetical protein
MRKRLRTAAWVTAISLGASAVLGIQVTASSTESSTVSASSAASDRHTPRDVTCHSGDILTGFFGDVTVARGNFCLLLQAIVEGDVTANNASQLGIDNSTITGDIQANNVANNGWICGSRIGGSVTVDKAKFDPIDDPLTWVIGDSVGASPSNTNCGNKNFDPVPGNFIVGDLTFDGNASGGVISNNDIEGALKCINNTPSPTGSGNQVDEANTGQCAALGGGADNDTMSPGDND